MKPEFQQARWHTPTLFELDSGGDTHDQYAPATAGEPEVPASLRRAKVGIPTLTQLEVVRHYTRLSQKNIGVDTSFYPLGSCTMKIPRAPTSTRSWATRSRRARSRWSSSSRSGSRR
jgi:glycine cleavage system protein P-like pyridoxal-binding family